MAVQIVNDYAFCVKRLSVMASPGPANPSGAGVANGQYEGEQVYVAAASLANAEAVLAAWYGSDLGPVTGGAIRTPGMLTTMTGS